MLSKLLPRGETGEVHAFCYRNVGSPSLPEHFAPPAQRQPGDDGARERDQLRKRVVELEQALAQQVAAARQAGFREGEAAGRIQAENSLKPVLDRMCRSIQDMVELKPRFRREMEMDAVQLSLGIAKRVLRRELSMDASALQALVHVAFERIGRNEITRVIVHPDHAAAVREALAQFTTRKIEIFGDGSREKGTLVFETNRGALDASIDSQLREIELGLADRLKWR